MKKRLFTLSLIGWLILILCSSTYAATVSTDEGIVFDTSSGTITDYTGSRYSITIPETIEGVPVTIIGANAFNGQGQKVQLLEVTLPNSIEVIRANAFANNRLTAITLSESILRIEEGAFKSNQIAKLAIPDSLVSLGSESFMYNGIVELTLGKGLDFITDSAFKGNALKSVIFSENIAVIGPQAFADNQLESVKFNPSIESIGRYAFGNNYLTNVTIPESVMEIDNSAFKNNKLENQTTFQLVNLAVSPSRINRFEDVISLSNGGHMINGASLVLSYVNDHGETISPSKTAVDPQTNANRTHNNLSIYYRIGDKITVTPPAIEGYKPLSKSEVTLTEAMTLVQLTYDKEKVEPLTYELNPDAVTAGRLYGDDRYKTAVEISKNAFRNTKTVVLVNGSRYADAVTASVLADRLHAPILLTSDNGIPQVTLDEITRLEAKEVVVIGGSAVISEASLNALSSLKIERVYGQNRYETSAEIYRKIVKVSGPVTQLILTTGQNYPDALSVSSMAIKERAPILLTEKDTVDPSVFALIDIPRERRPSMMTVIGGTNAISEQVVEKMRTRIFTTVIAGDNRYDTSLAIAKKAYPDASTVLLATGEGFADALAAGPSTALYKAPILLTPKSKVEPAVKAYIKDQNLIIIGGESAINQKVVDLLAN